MKRCFWVRIDNPLYVKYHDQEWGRPVHEDLVFFEFLVLEGAQAGLSWETILKRRQSYRQAFGQFDPKKVAKFGPKESKQLLLNPGIIRNRLKIKSAIENARTFLEIQKEFGSFDRFIWQFVGGKPILNRPRSQADYVSESAASLKMSKDLKKRGFRFVGPTICYAFMQACGLVNDHTRDCFRAPR